MARHGYPLVGDLLVAEPTLRDPNFCRSVVLMLDHDEDGAVGVVLTRPSELLVDAVCPGWGDVVDRPARVFQGGPVAADTVICVGVLDPMGSGLDNPAVARTAGLACLVDLSTEPEVARRALAGSRIFLGYAGWGGGQLEDEIAEGSWLVVPAVAEDIVADDPEALWERVLRRQGGWLAVAATFPDDPRAN